jgi:hypothetical protein
MATRWRTLLWRISVVAFLIGFCGALFRGFEGVSHDCQAWVTSPGYQLVQND